MRIQVTFSEETTQATEDVEGGAAYAKAGATWGSSRFIAGNLP